MWISFRGRLWGQKIRGVNGGEMAGAALPLRDHRLKAASVAIVDDDPDSRAAIRELIAGEGYATRTAENGIELLRMIETEHIDVVVLDVNLPGMHGIEVCRRLRAQLGYRIAVLFLSGSRAEPWDRIAGLEAGADDYMAKPCDPGELLARIGALARRLSADEIGSFESRALLTGRQREVVCLLAQGLDLQEIASRLFVTPATVRKHIERAYRALGVRSRSEAVAWAYNEGLVFPSPRTTVGHSSGTARSTDPDRRGRRSSDRSEQTRTAP